MNRTPIRPSHATRWGRASSLLPIAFLVTLAGCGGTAAPVAPPSSLASAPAASKPAAAGSPAAPASKPAASPSASAQASGAKEKLTIAYTSFTMDQLSPMVAKEQGLFDQNGIDAELVSIGAGSRPEAALLSGQVQMVEGGPEEISAALAGADNEFVAAPDPDFNFWLYGASDVKTAADLKGKRVAVTSLTSSTYTAARIAVKQLGLDPDKDVTYVAVNNPPAIFAAMQTGAAQAGSIGSTNIIQARSSNFNMLVDISKLGTHYPAGWYAVSKKWADTHTDLMTRMLKAGAQGVAYMIQQPEGTQKVLQKYSKNDDQAFLKGNYELVQPHLKKVPLVPVDGVKLVLDELAATEPQAKTADPNKYLDNHWVQQLSDSGFVDSLYK
jgi:ABC-type nitrate/sulfonate/bicarbonate transport system substrate-binding protein